MAWSRRLVVGVFGLAGLALAGCGAVSELDSEGAGGRAAGSGGQAGAGGISPAWLACRDVSECVLRSTECCEGCGSPDPQHAMSVNQRYLAALGAELCRGVNTPCPVPACSLPSTSYVAVVCREARCQAVDIRQDPLTACTQDGDCHLRYGTACCETNCSSASVAPVAVGRGFEQVVCGAAGPCYFSCPGTSLYRAICSAGHCRLAQ